MAKLAQNLLYQHPTTVLPVLDTSQERLEEAVDQLSTSKQVHFATYASLLWQCGTTKSLLHGKRVHAHIAKRQCDRETVLGNLLVEMYGRCGSPKDSVMVFERILHKDVGSWNIMLISYTQNGHLQDAREIFDRIPQRDAMSWNAIVTAYAQMGYASEALELFRLMDLNGFYSDKVTFIGVLRVCSTLGAVAEARAIHGDIRCSGFELDVVVGTAIIDMYGKCGCVEDAWDMFTRMPQRNVVTWTAMVVAYAQNGHLQEARNTFEQMPQRNVVSWNAMIAGYAQNGYLDDARRMFDKMTQRSVVSWTAIIAAYTQIGHPKEALHLFRLMHLEGMKPNKVTFTSIVDACTSLTALREGKLVHSQIIEDGLQSDTAVANSLVTMFAKCGALQDAEAIFMGMFHHRDIVSWTAMVAAYAQNGHSKEALGTSHMMQLEGMKPNGITFTSILTACSHAGLQNTARSYFISLLDSYGIKPTLDHYLCMIDLLGRAGRLADAEELIESMPFEPDVVAWTSLLCACRSNGDLDGSSRAADNIFQIEQQDAGTYVLLSNIINART